jgi:hypothetical protein
MGGENFIANDDTTEFRLHRAEKLKYSAPV